MVIKMKWNLNYIQKNAKPSFNFEENIEYDKALIEKLNRVDDILDIKVKGNLKYIDSISQCLIKYTVSGVMKVKSNGFIELSTANENKGVRPVVYLDFETLISTGVGTTSDPYVLK